MSVAPELLEILVCPECKGPLEQQREQSALACRRCKLSFPVDDNGTPHLIVDDASPLDEAALRPKP